MLTYKTFQIKQSILQSVVQLLFPVLSGILNASVIGTSLGRAPKLRVYLTRFGMRFG